MLWYRILRKGIRMDQTVKKKIKIIEPSYLLLYALTYDEITCKGINGTKRI